MKRVTYARMAESQAPTPKSARKSTSHAGGQSKPPRKISAPAEKSKFPNCVIHKSETCEHKTPNCTDFKNLGVQERYDVLKSVHACFRCMVSNHQRSTCKFKDPCESCGEDHHTLLCKKEMSPEVVCTDSNANRVVAHSNHAGVRKVGLYAITSAVVKPSRKEATIFLDNGSDSSWITDKAAKRLGASKLGKYVLEVRTTGGKETTYESQLYELDLVTLSGRIVTLELYGITNITGELSRLDLSVLSRLFPGYDCSALQRRNGEVDILIGSDNFGLHPKHELAAAGENLSIMEGAFGICLQGSHPDLKEGSTMDSNMVRVVKAVNPLIKSNCCHLTITSQVKHPLLNQPPIKSSRVFKCNSHLTMNKASAVERYTEGEELPTGSKPNMEDSPVGAIATEALNKTPDMFQSEDPEAVELIETGSYVDDLMGSLETLEEAQQLAGDTEKGESMDEENETQVLGVTWDPETEIITFQHSLNFSLKRQGIHILPDLKAEDVPAQIPEMNVLHQVMRNYDPGGCQQSTNTRRSFNLVQQVADTFWDQWRKTVSPAHVTGTGDTDILRPVQRLAWVVPVEGD